MSFPYYLLLLVYGAAVVGGIGFFGLNLYHLIKYGFFDFSGKVQTFLIIGVMVVIIGFTFLFLQDVRWTEQIDLLSDFSINLFSDTL